MKLDGNIVVVPLWMINSIKEKGVAISSLSDVYELQDHFSFDDMVSFYSVNGIFKDFNLQGLDYKLRDQLNCYGNLFKIFDLKPCSLGNNEHLNKKVLHSNILTESLVFLKELDGMRDLFDIMSTPSYLPSNVNPNSYVINLFHIQDRTYGLTFKPHDGIEMDIELTALSNNMKMLLTHYTYEQVFQTEIFHRWCSVIAYNQQQLMH